MKTNLYCPYTIELLFDFFNEFNIKTNEKYTQQIKDKVLDTILEMLNNKVIFVSEKNKNGFVIWDEPKEIIVERINNMWSENTNFQDFYNMVWFGYENWYIEALKKEGFEQEKIVWTNFIEKDIGDLQKWIEANKP
ncbi:hypothetical protein [Olleya marilimosa]|uniref:Uncharacterized protein n=1 Tax=Olleya marilimosa TaxID=272164 RepID=A0ABR8LRB0_9FLAO|nr:hypothetical protein [Olleya marilimosa]MBD3862761.1 hypothetical protein [Olleya marilimosa]